MQLYEIFSALIVLTAVFSFINFKYFKFQSSIGLMMFALLLSIVTVILGRFFPSLFENAQHIIASLNFSDFLLQYLLGFLLFAGSYNVDTKTLFKERRQVLLFAALGVLISTFIVGTLMYFVCTGLGISVAYIYCLLFGALISPTDPVAVLAILKKASVPKSLEMDIAGESLLNDGIAVVVFLSIYEIANLGAAHVGAKEIVGILMQEAVGGIVFGLVLGFIGTRVLLAANDDKLDVLITLALVMGGYTLATIIHVSAPLSIVVAGLSMSAQLGTTSWFSSVIKQHVDIFWETIDDILNAVLFMMIGLVALAITFEQDYVMAGLIAIGVVLVARFISVIIPIPLTNLRSGGKLSAKIAILTWGGLRGGISVALALSLEAGMHKDLIVTMTYIVVVFSILIQGLSVESLVKRTKLMDKKVSNIIH